MSRPDAAGEVRALTLLDALPPGCRAMSVDDGRNAPHLRRGEVAVIDPADCEPVHGELFAVGYGNGPAIMQAVWRTRGSLSAWWAPCLDRPRDWPEAEAWMRAGRHRGSLHGVVPSPGSSGSAVGLRAP